MSKVDDYNIGERCVHCARSVRAGSGRFVNRIPADSTWLVTTESGAELYVPVYGWMCAECLDEGDL